MDKSISDLLNKAGKFSDREQLLLEQELEHKAFKKGTFLLKKGATSSALFFVISGCFYHYYEDMDGNNNTIDLSAPGDWVINHKSFTTRKPSEYAIRAFEDSCVYELTIEAMHRLIAQSQTFLQMGKILEEATSRIDFFDKNNTPDEKYRYLLEYKPPLLQKFPQKIIASYLKITPETLSRVRNRLSKV